MYTPVPPFQAREIFGHPPSFWSISRFPCGVPCPAPLCLYYYWDRIRKSTGTEKLFWSRLMELEHSLLFVSNWWSESSNAQRAVVLKPETLTWLSERIPASAIMASGANPVTFSHIIKCMTQASQAPKGLHHTIRFPGFQLPSCSFVQSFKHTGEVDTTIPGGREFERSRDGYVKPSPSSQRRFRH